MFEILNTCDEHNWINDVCKAFGRIIVEPIHQNRVLHLAPLPSITPQTTVMGLLEDLEPATEDSGEHNQQGGNEGNEEVRDEMDLDAE